MALGIEEKPTRTAEKKVPQKRKQREAETLQPSRTSRRLNGEAAANVYVQEDEGGLTLGGDAKEIATLTAERRAAQEASRAEAWARAASASGASASAAAVGAAPPEREEFIELPTPLFHLNSFIESEAKRNRAFGLFLSEGIATPGFRRASESTLEQIHRQWPLDEAFKPVLFDMLLDDYKRSTDGHGKESSARQRALWLTTCRPGAYIVCRHVYQDCPYAPSALKGVNGQYLGGVYAIGRVVEFPPPQSPADDALVSHIPDERLDALGMQRYYIHANAKVDWFALGYMDQLRPQTKGYIDQVCQPTIQQVLKGSGNKKTYHQACRADLWDKATIQIRDQINAGMFSEAPAPLTVD